MASGGYRPGGGRPKGAKNRPREVIKAEDFLMRKPVGSPQFTSALEFAMSVINDEAAEKSDKIRLAIAAMPFQHPKIEARTTGKKDEAAEAARTAGDGTEWGNDLAGLTARLN